ncbi:uncharacterized protein EV154DRAFT_501861 [Mucor mucedo]|uniref:uncharacterized protein n=1 Tax=Mucor mucedo TaxID=29922 RepID=UPI00221EE6DA|nr:uncharacterized protein EV154DRAFT_501861 [Mucor mucedo]KAI7893397.1 hypothetical protein EV154DRAFT_501861 [Mucor mucedo]
MKALRVKVESHLRAVGSISIVLLSQQMKLPYSLLKLVTMDHEDYIRYNQIPDVISTREYIDDCKSNIRTALETTDEPLVMFKLQKSLNIQEDMFYLLLEHIVKESTFTLGTLRGKKSRAIFEPKSYKDGQIALIQSIFDSNECISFHTIENLYPYANAKDIIADHYDSTTYFTLHSCLIKKSVKEKAKDALESATDYCDFNDHLPPNLTFDDVNKVMDIVMSEINTDHKRLVILEGGYVTTREYIDKTVLRTRDYLLNLARTLKQKNSSEVLSATKMSPSSIVKALESTGCPYKIAEKIVPYTRVAILNQFADILQTPFIEAQEIVSADKWVVQYKARELDTVLNLGQSIYYNYQAIQVFGDGSAKKSLEKFVLKTQCVDFLYHLVIYTILSQSFNKAEVAESTSLCITIEDIEKQAILDAKQQKYVITYFIRENDHKYDKTSIVEIEEILKKKNLSLFISDILIEDKQHLFKNLTSPQTKR